MDPEQKKQAIVGGVIGVVLAGVLLWQFVLKPGPGSGADSADTGAQEEDLIDDVGFVFAEKDMDALAESVDMLDFNYQAMRLAAEARDPMRPLTQRPPGGGNGDTGPVRPEQEMFLSAIRARAISGIVWDEVNPCAVVDNEIVFVDSRVLLDKANPAASDCLVVVDIGKDYVRFRGGDVEEAVSLKE